MLIRPSIRDLLLFGGGGGSDPYGDALAALGPVVWYRLDETQGTTMVDAMGRLNGTYSGVTLGQAPLVKGGKFGTRFPTTSATATTPDHAALHVASFTVVVWVLASGADINFGRGVADGGAVSASVFNWRIDWESGGSIRWAVNNSAAVGGTGSGFDDGLRHMVVGRYTSGGLATMFVDNVSRGSTTPATLTPNAGGIRLGVAQGVGNYIGNMDEFAFFDKVLSDADVANLWALGR